MTELPDLYNKDSKNNTRIWSIKVIQVDDKCFIETRFGTQGMKITVNTKEIKSGKNKGKKNETSVLEQAIFDAKSLWKNKKDKGYSENIDNEKEISPMLALDYNKRYKDIIFPCLTQPKLDGCRCIYKNKQLLSRNNKVFSNPVHILEELKNLNIVLDGELYSSSKGFQQTVSSIKNDKKICSLDLEYWVFDIINDKPFYERYKELQEIIKKGNYKYIKLVDTIVCEEKDNIKYNHSKYIEQGYEGTIIRNSKGKYKTNNRSKDLQKYKDFLDEEFLITGFSEGIGNDKGCIIFVCETKEGKRFTCRPKGTREKRQEMFIEGEKFLNSSITVRFQEYTNEKIPRFPVGITIRNYE